MLTTSSVFEIIYDDRDPVSFVSACISLIPALSVVVLVAFVLVPTHLSRNAARLLLILSANHVIVRLMKRKVGLCGSTAFMFCAATTSFLLGKMPPAGRFMLWRYGVWIVAIIVAAASVKHSALQSQHNRVHSNPADKPVTALAALLGAVAGAIAAGLLVRLTFVKTLAATITRHIHQLN